MRRCPSWVQFSVSPIVFALYTICISSNFAKFRGLWGHGNIWNVTKTHSKFKSCEIACLFSVIQLFRYSRTKQNFKNGCTTETDVTGKRYFTELKMNFWCTFYTAPVTGVFPAQGVSNAENVPFDDVITWPKQMVAPSVYRYTFGTYDKVPIPALFGSNKKMCGKIWSSRKYFF